VWFGAKMSTRLTLSSVLILLISALPASAACGGSADFFTPFGERVATLKYSGRLIILQRPHLTDDKIDLSTSGDASVLSSGCYKLPIADESEITLSVNNVVQGRDLLPRTFLGVQIIQLAKRVDKQEIDLEIYRENQFMRGSKALAPITPPRLLPIDLQQWNKAHDTDDIDVNDNALGTSWHGSPARGTDNSWSYKTCWTIEPDNHCGNLDVTPSIQNRKVLIQNRLFSFFPSPESKLGKGVGFVILKRPETQQIIIRYHSPSSQQNGEVELCFQDCTLP
jgi:hypothetical protein